MCRDEELCFYNYIEHCLKTFYRNFCHTSISLLISAAFHHWTQLFSSFWKNSYPHSTFPKRE